ncbi:MAG: hypothetical protein U5Q16_13665 [Gammaproteobacteria bacterium]|nr:hypothetical protein [Gammaproteobacteria bacterium]
MRQQAGTVPAVLRGLRIYVLPGAILQSVNIAGGYGRIAWGYLVVFLIPLFTVGMYRLLHAGFR